MRQLRRIGLALAVLGGALLMGAPEAVQADPSKITVGAQRSVLARAGTRLLSTPSPRGTQVKLLPHGTRVRVDEVRGRYIRVTEFNGETAGASGWLKATSTVAPYALTQGGQRGAIASGRATARATRDGAGITRRDTSAAARQFSEKTEAGHKTASDAAIRRAYQLLDAILEVKKPTVERVEAFIAEGNLGRPGGRQAPASGN